MASANQAPVAAYSFDAGEGETLEDVTGNEHDGAIEGPEWTDRGRFGNALQFNGESEDCVTVPDESGELQLTEELTLEAWVKPSGPTEDDPIIFKEALGIGGKPGYALGIGVTSSGKPEGVIGEEGELENVEAPSKIDTNVWTHLAFTYDGAHMRLYVNGSLVATQAQADAPLAAPGDLKIGCSAWWWEEGFNGKIDEVRIYDRALSAGEIGGDSAAPIQTPQKAPVAAYSFDAGEGETLEDVTGNEHDGAIEGPEWTDRGRFGNALQFNGESEDCVTVPDESGELQLTEELTLEAWVKPSGPTEDDPIIFKEALGIGGKPGYALGIGVTSSGKPEGVIGEEGELENVEAPSKIDTNVWTHLAFTYDGAHMRLYVNGSLVATQAQADAPLAAPGDLKIGCSAWWWEEGFNGKIDEVRIYDRALSAGEIGGDSAAPIQTPQKAPVAAYSFDAGEGETLEDVTGNEHDGAIEGPEWTDRGRFGNALQFNGEEGECVTIPDAEDLRTTEEMTLEAWVKPTAPAENDPIIYKSSWGYTGSALGIGIWSEGKPEGLIGEGEGEFENVVGPKAIEGNVWTHLAFTFDGAHMRLYVNGELVATKAQSEGPPWGEGDLVIGCNPNYAPEVFNGKIDEVRIYDRALSAGEIGGDSAAPIQTPQKAPVAAYSFDEGEGEVAHDDSGEHDGTVEGAEWTDRGRYNGALEFDASEDHCVTVPDSPALQLTEEFTLEAWVWPSAETEDDPVVFKETEDFMSYALFLTQGGYPEGAIGTSPYELATSKGSEALPQDEWTHVAATYDGAKLRVYVDGELVKSVNSASPIASEEPLRIGCSRDWEEGFTGKIDEVRVYDRALDGDEIQDDSAAPVETAPAGPVAAYSFDAGEGETLEDVTGNEHDGAIEGPEWTDRGKFGSTLRFDGEDDCVTVPDSEDLQLEEDFTLESWVKPQGDGDSEPILFKEKPYFGAYGLYYGIYNEGNMEGLLGHEWEFKRTVNGASQEPNVWTHVALTYDGAHMRFYVNGELVDTTFAPDDAEPSSGDLKIGCSEEFEDNFEGLIDEVRIYNRALDAGEAADVLAPRFHGPFHAYAYQIAGAETTEIFFDEAEDPPLPEGQPGSGVDLYKYRTSVNESAYTGWKESSVPYFALAGVHEGDVISVQITLRDRVWNESGVYESTVIAPPAGPPAPGEYSPAEGAPGAPGGTCAAEPERSGCPQVEKIIVVPTSEETSTPYGPAMSARGVPPGNKCAVMATYPRVARFNSAHTEGQNECLPGNGVIYTELFAKLYKYQEDGELQFRGSSPSGRRSGAGLTTVNHYSKCHGRTDFNWKAEAWAYTDIEGVGYFGTNLKVRSIPCN